MPDGRVTPCDHLPAVRLGSLPERSLEEILTGEEARRFIGTHTARRRTLDRCGTCPIAEYCPGSCPASPGSELTCLRNYVGRP